MKRATILRGVLPAIVLVTGAMTELAASDPSQMALASLTTPDTSTAREALPAEKSRLARLLKEASLSPGVLDVARLGDAHTGEGVMMAFVNHSEVAYKLRAEDITYLRDNSVPDNIITAMIERGAILRDRPAPAPTAPPSPTVQNVIHWSPSETVNTVTFVPAPVTPEPVSTVTVIGRSDLRRGLSQWNHPYGVARPGMYRNNFSSYHVSYPVVYRVGSAHHRPPFRYGGSLACR